MDPHEAIDLTREAVWTAVLIGSPVLLAGLLVGLVVGLLQAITQIQEQSVSFVPKLLAMVVALSLAMPWLVARMIQYSAELIDGIPGRF